jgi:hypothetical protein
MTNSTTDDYGEWLRLAEEALAPVAAGDSSADR